MTQQLTITNILLTDIHMDQEFNCRGQIAPIDVIDLAKDIEQRGLIQPVTVAPYTAAKAKETGFPYRLIAGFRRYTAHKIIKRTHVPAIIREDMIDEAQARLFNLSENIQRKDLDILQESRALLKLKEVGITENEASAKLGKSRGWVQVRYMLLDLPEEIQVEVAAGFITQTQIRELYTINHVSGKNRCFEAAKKLKEAKQNGRANVTINPNKTKPTAKHHRRRDEIFVMMAHLQEVIGNGLHTRALSWAGGEISDNELFETIKAILAKEGKTYVPPTALFGE